MLESQLAQLAAAVPLLEKGKIPGQPEDLETTNRVDIHNAANYYTQPADVKWIDYSLLDKKSNPGRPVIPISIGCHVFPEAICDFGTSVNIMPKRQEEMREHQSYWVDHSFVQQKPSSMQSMLRLSFPSKTRKRSFHSRTASCTLLHTHRRCTYKNNQQCPERRTIEIGG
jgi:hypothetical protein